MNATHWKAALGKVATAGLVAAALAVATPSRAEAQVSFGVRIGGPRYAAPAYRRPVYVAPAPVYVGPGYGYGYYGRPYAFRHEGWDHRWGR